MKQEQLRKYLIFISIILIYICIQLYYFEGVVGADSFYYLSFLYDNVSISFGSGMLLPIFIKIFRYNTIYLNPIIGIISLIFIYKIIKFLDNKKYINALIITFLCSIFPFFIMNTRLGMLDKNALYMLSAIIFIYGLVTYKHFYAFGSLFLIYISWNGFYVFLGLLLMSFTLDIVIKYKKEYSFFVISLFSLIIFILIKKLNYDDVGELTSAIYFYNGLIFFILILFFYSMFLLYEKMDGLILMSISSFIIIYRMHSFIIAPVMILIFNLCSISKYKKIFLIIIAILFFINIPTALYHTMDTDIKESKNFIETMSKNNSCIFTDWGKGNMYQYYFNDKMIINKGHPSNIDAINAFYINGTMSLPECIYMYDIDDIKIYKSLPDFLNVTCNKKYCVVV